MASLKSLNELFNNTLFRIPDYQRGYAWTPNQLKDFWDDLHNLNDLKSHYTGVLTVKGVTAQVSNSEKWHEEQWLLKERGYKAYFVVDGQQRLTTSIIFIQALVEIVKGLKENNDKPDSELYIGSFSIKDIRETYLLVSKPPHNIIKTYKFGYESDNPSFQFLRYRIFNEESSGTINETFYTLNLENSKRFFLEKIKGVLELEGIEGIAALFKKLTVNFKFNFYEIEEDFDVFVAFETMNNRGKKLSNLELLKNRLIYLTTLYEPHELKEDDRISLRTKIDDAWKEVYYQLGRNKNHPLNDDEFLVAHWIMSFPYKREKGSDYIDFLLNQKFTPKNIFEKVEIPVTSLEEFEEVKELDVDDEDDDETEEDNQITSRRVSRLKPKEIEQYVNSLKAAAVFWYNSSNPFDSGAVLTKAEREWLDRLNRIGISYFRPLVTASFLNDEIDSSQRVKLFKAIERFIFIAFRLKNAFSNYRNSEFYRAARLLKSKEWDIDGIIESLNNRLAFCFNEHDSGNKFFDYAPFKKYIDKHFQNGGGFYWWNGLRYFLYEYEMSLVKQRGSQKIDWALFVKTDGDKISIEHILPQTPDKPCWKTLLKGVSKKEVNKLQGSLGNLVPLSRSINSSIQNDCFADKKKAKLDDEGEKIRQGYHDGSHSEIEISMEEKWASEEILNRGIKLLSFMEKRWSLQFENETAKIELLGLEFLTEDEPKSKSDK
jgi:hypothetical protein